MNQGPTEEESIKESIRRYEEYFRPNVVSNPDKRQFTTLDIASFLDRSPSSLKWLFATLRTRNIGHRKSRERYTWFSATEVRRALKIYQADMKFGKNSDSSSGADDISEALDKLARLLKMSDEQS